VTEGSRSWPANASAGSPGNSCCSPKISTYTKNSVGTTSASRRSRKVVIGYGIAELGPSTLRPYIQMREDVTMPADPGNEKPKSDVLAENTRSATVRTCSPSRVELWGAMRGTV